MGAEASRAGDYAQTISNKGVHTINTQMRVDSAKGYSTLIAGKSQTETRLGTDTRPST